MDEKTKYPGMALMIASGTFAVLTLAGVAVYAALIGFTALAQPSSSSSSVETTDIVIIVTVMIIAVLLVLVLYGSIAFGGFCLMHRRRYVFAMTGAILALVAGIPCSCLPINSLVFLPVGIWALVTLMDPAVKDNFES